ncbi:hypothetical protein BGX29_007149 [Mortierella sp. GBA35]|nr:hypothetical protein BGX23_012232 [Mortierella sp. AD031]KAF9099398.1 hypothetical protein BGX29_007149 [Mortierella sp. GBA35]KAG0204161.1 hypothetical protein BGX33_008675 [Mortierella sp. NVP41]
MTVIITYAMVASGAYTNYKKTQARSAVAARPASSASLKINIPTAAISALDRARALSPPSTPPLLSASSSMSDSSDGGRNMFDDGIILDKFELKCENTRRRSQEFFFPNQTQFESAVPIVTSARDVVLKDTHPVVHSAYSDYEDDSVMTKDGRYIVRLL